MDKLTWMGRKRTTGASLEVRHHRSAFDVVYRRATGSQPVEHVVTHDAIGCIFSAATASLIFCSNSGPVPGFQLTDNHKIGNASVCDLPSIFFDHPEAERLQRCIREIHNLCFPLDKNDFMTRMEISSKFGRPRVEAR